MGNDLDFDRFLRTYTSAAGIVPTNFAIVRFGDSAELADELISLVLAGKKRATSSLRRDFGTLDRTLPQPGDLGIVVDSKQSPRCIIRTVQVEIRPLKAVDERFAWDEGGGDRSLAWWRSAHARYFKRQGAREGFAVDDATEVVLERFEIVWPPEFADVRVSVS